MMSKKLLLGLSFLFFATSVSAAYTIDWNQINCATYQYDGIILPNARIELPKQAASLFNDEIINVVVESDAGVKKFSAVVIDGIVSDIACSEREDSTLRIIAESSAIERIINSPGPVSAFKDAKARNEISIQPNRVITLFKIFFLDIALAFQQ